MIRRSGYTLNHTNLDYFPSLDYVRYKIFNKQATCLWYVIRIIHGKLLTKIGKWSLYLADDIPFQFVI